MKRTLAIIAAALLASAALGQSLTGTTPAATYKDLLHLSNTNLGLDSTLRTVYDGAGNASGASLSTGMLRNSRDGDTVAAIIAAINGHVYAQIVPVTTTIMAALATITDASPAKRYAVYIPNGTYTEEVQAKDYVDLIGQSRGGVVITSASQAVATMQVGGLDCLVANLTITHVTAGGETAQYAVHIDANSPVANTRVYTIVYDCTISTVGATASPAFGGGFRGLQTCYLVDSSFVTGNATNTALYVHNSNSVQTLPAETYVINCTASGGIYGFQYQNVGSTQPDWLAVVGGSYTGSTNDILVANSGAGAGETYVYISPDVVGTASLVDPAKAVSTMIRASIPRRSAEPQPGESWSDGTTTYLSDSTQTTWAIASGSIKPISAAAVYYFDPAKKASVVSNLDGYAFYANNTASLYDSGDGILHVVSAATFSQPVTAAQFKLSALNTAPANATDTGTLGEIRIVNGFIYVCVATNTWQRAAIATW